MNREDAWKLERESLIRLANHNTFMAVTEAFEKGWEMAMIRDKKSVRGEMMKKKATWRWLCRRAVK